MKRKHVVRYWYDHACIRRTRRLPRYHSSYALPLLLISSPDGAFSTPFPIPCLQCAMITTYPQSGNDEMARVSVMSVMTVPPTFPELAQTSTWTTSHFLPGRPSSPIKCAKAGQGSVAHSLSLKVLIRLLVLSPGFVFVFVCVCAPPFWRLGESRRYDSWTNK